MEDKEKEIVKKYPLRSSTPQELDEELRILNDLKVIEYKIIGEKDFNVNFTQDFTKYTELNKKEIARIATLALLDIIERHVKDNVDESDGRIIYYTTALFSYVQFTGQLHKLDIKDIPKMTALANRVEDLNETFQKVKQGLI